MLFKRFSVLLTPILILLGLELLFYFQQNIKMIVIIWLLLLVLLVLTLKFLIKERFYQPQFWTLSLLPILLFICSSSYLLVLGWGLMRHLVIVLLAMILAAYLENLFMFYYYPQGYKKDSLENLSVFFNILIFFLLILNLNAVNIFLNPPFWTLSLILVAVLSLLLWQYFRIIKLSSNLRTVYLLVVNLLVLEFFWAMSFLPSNLYVHSIILTIIYYFIFNSLRMKLTESFDKKSFWRYLIISLILLIIIIITSRWS